MLQSDFSKDVIRLFDQSSTFMAFLRGREHQIEFVNPAYMTLVGERQVVGLTIAEALPEAIEQGFVAMLDQAFQSGQAVTATAAQYNRQFGGETTELYLDFVYQPILEDSVVTGILVQGVDVTERTRAEHALIAARNAAEAAEIAKSDFISNLSHNIRSPMSAVVGLANILTTTHPLSQEQSGYINALLMSAESVLSQVSDMVENARIEARMIDLESVEFSPVYLIEEVVGSISPQVRDKGLALAVEVTCDVDERLVGDVDRIRQIVNELCSNAIRFTETGELTLSLECRTSGMKERSLIVKVSDTGVGMVTEKIDTLFRQSVDAGVGLKHRYGGTGLGLSIAKTLSEIMGGTLTVESAPGAGSTFTATLPLLTAVGTEISETEENPESTVLQFLPEEVPQILLVEDYEPNVLVATTLIERLGFRVDVALNGLAAVEKARTGQYTMALMDVQMPGMNGMEATRMIREEEGLDARRHLPIVGVTAHSLAVDRMRCLDAGMDDFLPKPFSAEDLQAKILGVLGARNESV